MADKLSSIEAHVGYWLRMVSNQVSQSFARKVEGAGATVAEWVILRFLYGKKDTQAVTIAQVIGLTKGAVSKLVARLEAKDLVTRADSQTDARSERLNLTKKGQRLVPRLAELADQNDDEFFKELSAKETAELLRLIKKVVAAKKILTTPIK